MIREKNEQLTLERPPVLEDTEKRLFCGFDKEVDVKLRFGKDRKSGDMVWKIKNGFGKRQEVPVKFYDGSAVFDRRGFSEQFLNEFMVFVEKEFEYMTLHHRPETEYNYNPWTERLPGLKRSGFQDVWNN